MKALILAAALMGCQATEPLPMVHIFRGSQDAIAYTTDRDGANLPAQYRPWRRLQSIPRSDPRLSVGRDRAAMQEVDARGYSVSFMRVRVQAAR